MSNVTARNRKQLKRREQALVRDGEKPCCARLLAFNDPESTFVVEVSCVECDASLAIRPRQGQGEDFAKKIFKLAMESGKVCLHKVGDVVAGEVVTAAAVCPCGKARWNKKLEGNS